MLLVTFVCFLEVIGQMQATPGKLDAVLSALPPFPCFSHIVHVKLSTAGTAGSLGLLSVYILIALIMLFPGPVYMGLSHATVWSEALPSFAFPKAALPPVKLMPVQGFTHPSQTLTVPSFCQCCGPL